MCVLCGQSTHESEPQITNKKLQIIEKQTRLALVLDLDHTLLNTTTLSNMTSAETEFLTPLVDSLNLLEQENPSGALFMLENRLEMTKLRPFVRTFLEEASQLFDLYIFTMGIWHYASDMVYLLDPNSKYFDRVRVFTRDDATLNEEKGLSVVPVVKSACLIIDDLEVVWPCDKANLIQIEKYEYFASSCNRKSLSELKADESEGSGSLAKVLAVLRRVHALYFEGDDSDVREILRNIRKEVLRGVRVVFSSCLRVSDGGDDEDPGNVVARDIEKKAVALGAVWEARVGPTVTHVVAEDPTSSAAVWAVKEGKFLVSRRWIEAAYYSWERPSENMYHVRINVCST